MVYEVDYNYWRGVVDFFSDFEPLPEELKNRLQSCIKANEHKAKKILEDFEVNFYGK